MHLNSLGLANKIWMLFMHLRGLAKTCDGLKYNTSDKRHLWSTAHICGCSLSASAWQTGYQHCKQPPCHQPLPHNQAFPTALVTGPPGPGFVFRLAIYPDITYSKRQITAFQEQLHISLSWSLLHHIVDTNLGHHSTHAQIETLYDHLLSYCGPPLTAYAFSST